MSSPYPPPQGGYGAHGGGPHGGGGGYGQQQHQGSYGGGGGAGYGGGQAGGYGGQQGGGYGNNQHGGGYGGGGQQQHGGYGGGGQQQHGGYGGGGGGGGYGGRPAPPAPPGGGNPQLYNWFKAVDRDGSNHISAVELQQALVNGDWSAFDIDTVRMLLNIFDVDRTGTITFEEFQGLWQYIQDWQRVFRHFDADSSGTIEAHELSRALNQFGYNLSPKLLHLIEVKYAFKPPDKSDPAGSLPGPGNKSRGITFDRFVRCCVVVKTLTESFQRADQDKDGWVNLSYEQFMDIVLSAP